MSLCISSPSTAFGVIGQHQSSVSIRLPGDVHSTFVCLVVHLSEDQAELLAFSSMLS